MSDYFFFREDLSVKFLGLERQHHLQVWLHTNDNAMLKARKVSWMNPKCGTQGFLLKFTPGFRQAWAKMLDVEGGFNPLVKVSFQLLLYFSDILCWSSPLLGYCPRLLRLHIRAADVWEGRRQQGVCLSVRILQIMEIHAFTPRKYGSRNTTRWNLRKKIQSILTTPFPSLQFNSVVNLWPASTSGPELS